MGREEMRALSCSEAVGLQAYCITFKFPNLLAVQREWFRQQIFWVTDFSNRPGAGGPRGHAPGVCARTGPGKGLQIIGKLSERRGGLPGARWEGRGGEQG